MKLMSLSVYYRNDQPDGFGFTLFSEGDCLDFALANLKENYTLMWRQSVLEGTETALVLDLTDQLMQCARAKNTLTMTDPLLYIALGNVWLLIEMGALDEDEFNGLVYGYGGVSRPNRNIFVRDLEL